MKVFYSTKGGEKEATREGSREVSPEAIFGIRRKFTITYLVMPDGTETEDITQDLAMLATGVPYFSEMVDGCYPVSKRAREIDSLNDFWEVVVEFDSFTPEFNPSGFTLDSNGQVVDNPDNFELSWDTEFIETDLRWDAETGEPVVNKVGEIIPLTRRVSVAVLTITRLQTTFNPNWISDYTDHTNSTVIYGCNPRIILLDTIRAPLVYIEGQPKYQVTFVLKFLNTKVLDPNQLGTGNKIQPGWQTLVLHQGTKYIADPGEITPDDRLVADGATVHHPFVDANKNPTTGNLDANGRKLIPNTNPHYLTWNKHPKVDFKPLQLPDLPNFAP